MTAGEAKDRENGRQRRVAEVQGVRDPPGSWLQRTRSKEAREKRSYSSGMVSTSSSRKVDLERAHRAASRRPPFRLAVWSRRGEYVVDEGEWIPAQPRSTRR